PERKSFFRSMIQIEPDVAEVFPDSRSVNEALRFLIRITREKNYHPMAILPMPNDIIECGVTGK
ncbi:MAG: hypothetical protein FP811_10205, partial [Desulfobacteraceae bacterium]|nr:hypothetical protein [Desulfobacteraceae bacterium]